MDNLQQLFRMLQGMSQEEQLAFLNSLDDGTASALSNYISSGNAGIDITPAISAAPQVAATAGGLGGKLGTMLGTGAGKFRSAMSNGLGSVKGLFANLNNSYKDTTGNALWSKAGGIDGLGKLANWGGAIYQGGKAIGNITGADNAQSDYDQLAKDIRMSVAANPMYASSLTMDQKKMLRQAKSGTQKNDFGNAISGVGRGLPDIIKNAALGFATGGVPGAAIQGIGTAVNKGIEGYKSGTEEASAQLQALYDRLLQSEQEYNMMKRPQGLIGSGLQTRYVNQLW